MLNLNKNELAITISMLEVMIENYKDTASIMAKQAIENAESALNKMLQSQKIAPQSSKFPSEAQLLELGFVRCKDDYAQSEAAKSGVIYDQKIVSYERDLVADIRLYISYLTDVDEGTGSKQDEELSLLAGNEYIVLPYSPTLRVITAIVTCFESIKQKEGDF